MNTNRIFHVIFNTIFRKFARHLVKTGVNTGIDVAARRGKSQEDMTQAEKQREKVQADQAKSLKKRLQKSERMMRRLF